MQDEGGFDSRIPADLLPDVLDVGVEIGVDPTSGELESFFGMLIREYEHAGNLGTELRDWLRSRVKGAFRTVTGAPPRWIQNPQWPLCDGRPMTFVGEIELPASARLFHDDAVFYVFLDEQTGETRALVQIA